MHARIDSPALTVPGALEALHGLGNAAKRAGVPETTLLLVMLRASQINGCSICVDMHSRELKLAGERDERIFSLAAWARNAVLQRRGARSVGPDRGRHPPG